jgi:hypothetical protein
MPLCFFFAGALLAICRLFSDVPCCQKVFRLYTTALFISEQILLPQVEIIRCILYGKNMGRPLRSVRVQTCFTYGCTAKSSKRVPVRTLVDLYGRAVPYPPKSCPNQ